MYPLSEALTSTLTSTNIYTVLLSTTDLLANTCQTQTETDYGIYQMHLIDTRNTVLDRGLNIEVRPTALPRPRALAITTVSQYFIYGTRTP